jgi:hypothetical protein
MPPSCSTSTYSRSWDAVTVMSGSPLDPVAASTLIRKRRSKYIYLRALWRVPSGQMTVALPFHRDLIDRATRAADQLAGDSRLRSAAYFLRRPALADNIIASVWHSLQAAEALATHGRRVDQRRLRGLMGDELYAFFRTDDPVLQDDRRHALAHGRLIAEEGLITKNTELQERVVAELRQTLGGAGAQAFTPVRGFQVFDSLTVFLEPISEPPNLPVLVTAAVEGAIHPHSDPRLVDTATARRLWRR